MKLAKMFLVVMALFLICNAATLAADPEISLDAVFGEGDWMFNGGDEGGENGGCLRKLSKSGGWEEETDLTGLWLDLRYPVKTYRFGLGVGFGEEDFAEGDDNFRILGFNAGYALLERETWEVVPYLGYLYLDLGGYDVEGAVIGLDWRWRMSSRFSLEAGAGYAFEPKVEEDDVSYRDESLWNVRAKVNYHINPRWAVGVGYRGYRFSGENGEYDEVDADYDLITVGATYTWARQAQPVPPAPPAPPVRPEPEPQPEPKPEPAPKPVSPEVKKVHRLVKPVFFDFDVAEIREDQKPVLDRDIEVLKDHPSLYILVGGHADHVGKRNYNKRLSLRRARNVADYLVAGGIDPGRISIYAYGEEYPYNKYETNPHWESDRWVDILVFEDPPGEEMGIDKRGEIIGLE